MTILYQHWKPNEIRRIEEGIKLGFTPNEIHQLFPHRTLASVKNFMNKKFPKYKSPRVKKRSIHASYQLDAITLDRIAVVAETYGATRSDTVRLAVKMLYEIAIEQENEDES